MNEILPIGSVVLLEGGRKKLVIMGIFPFDEESPDKIYDYMAVPYPEGYMGNESMVLFRHGDIQKVIFRGYEEEERRIMLEALGNLYEETARMLGDEFKK